MDERREEVGPGALPGRPQVLEDELILRRRHQALTFRNAYGWAIIYILVTEAAASIVYFVLIGRGTLHVAAWTSNVFFASVFGQVVGLAAIVTRHLFPPDRE
jgi:hypothetical protein